MKHLTVLRVCSIVFASSLEAAAEAPCKKCERLFDGRSFAGWIDDSEGAWVVRDGALRGLGTSTGPLYTREDFGDFRLVFTVRQVGPGHKPNILVWGQRPAPGERGSRTLDAIQVQPPWGSMWDYRKGRNDDPMKSGLAVRVAPKPAHSPNEWSRCEVLARMATGSLRVACCELEEAATCDGVEIVRFTDPSAARKGPLGLQTHNTGQEQEYKDIWVERDPPKDELVTVPKRP